MLIDRFRFRRHRASRVPQARVDRRSGAPERHRPAPMPRMRWYS